MRRCPADLPEEPVHDGAPASHLSEKIETRIRGKWFAFGRPQRARHSLIPQSWECLLDRLVHHRLPRAGGSLAPLLLADIGKDQAEIRRGRVPFCWWGRIPAAARAVRADRRKSCRRG